ncbi:hypothetical protein COY27_00705 [Candidatus Woesearchaeota archaeon CG_4_10_14_0_2_um_filter_33_13]|nr:MAG: hypothetical protein COY27_00705 [Candidatus Woesearchaeota archaeon CG_4_10_14_0_2_um_filter_33_13]
MCYSEKVQLITGLIIIVVSVLYYYVYKLNYKKTNKEWLSRFLNNIIIGFLCIGGHQLFEFLSLVTGNVKIYKIGLIISISSMYFFLRSLEVLTNKDIHSKWSWLLISIVGIHAFLTPMQFMEKNFYLQHLSAFIWAGVWMFLFIYWHICAINIRKELKTQKSKRTIIYYLFATVDISFLLSLGYTFLGYFRYSVNVCYDSPSIWCTFFVIQAFFVPFFLSSFHFTFKRPHHKTKNETKKTIIIILISLLILVGLIATLPFFKCLTLKFVFP